MMREILNSILYYNYRPDCQCRGLSDSILSSVREEKHDSDAETLRTRAITALRDAVDAELESVSDGATHVVPLSAGLDSRAILAVLVDHPEIDSDQIRTVSFGTPGTWDYELGQEVASAAGVSNTAVDLTGSSFDWTEASLREYVADSNCPGGVFDGYVQSTAQLMVPAGSEIWVGFLGDVSSGVVQPKEPYGDWESAYESFAEREQYATGLTSSEYDPTAPLPSEPYISQDALSYEEQLDMAHRQQCAIAPVVGITHRHRAPFTQPAWLEFSLNLPRTHRHKRSLFIDAFSDAFPTLFSLPTDAYGGLPLSACEIRRLMRRGRYRLLLKLSRLTNWNYTHPDTNYINFRSAFRSGQLHDVAKSLLSDFSEREIAPWIDVNEVWRTHQDGTDRSREILVLCSAELIVSEFHEFTTPPAKEIITIE